MKNLKKVLALVMAFAMAFTMMAGAAYTDQDDIQATDAVELLATLNVMTGKGDGMFHPNDTITRAEICRIIYTIRNEGNDNANAYADMQTSFQDLTSADDWAKGYIKHCQSVGLISGRNEAGTVFGPQDPVTGVELAVICLRVLGYDPAKAGIGGESWSTRTVGLANEAGLLKNVNMESVTGPCERQWAAQIMANMLDAYTVRWSADGDKYTIYAEDGTENKKVGREYMKLYTSVGTLISVSGTSLTIDQNVSDRADSDPHNGLTAFTNVKADYSELLGQKVKVLYSDGKANSVIGVYGLSGNTVYTVNASAVESDGDSKVKFDGKSYTIEAIDPITDRDGIRTGDKSLSNQIDVAYMNIDGAQFNNKGFTAQTGVEYLPEGDETSSSTTSNTTKYFTSKVFDDWNNSSAVMKFVDSDENGRLDQVIITDYAAAEVTSANSTSIVAGKTYNHSDELIDEGIAQNDWVSISYNRFEDCKEIKKIDVTTGKLDGLKKESTSEGKNGITKVAATDKTGDKLKFNEYRVDNVWFNNAIDKNNRTDINTVTAGDDIEYILLNGTAWKIKRAGSGNLEDVVDVAMVVSTNKGNTGVNGEQAKLQFFNDTTAVVDVDSYDNTNGRVPFGSLVPGNLYEYSVSGGKYIFENLESGENDSTYKDYYGAYTYMNNTKSYTFKSDKIDGKTIDDKAKVILYGKNSSNNIDSDVITGRQLKNLNRAGEIKNVYYFTADIDGLNRAAALAMTVDTLPTSYTSNDNYGYILSDAIYAEGNNSVSYSLLLESGETVTVWERSTRTDDRVANTLIGYKSLAAEDANGRRYIDDVTLYGLNTNGFGVGAITSVNGGQTSVEIRNSNNGLVPLDVANDTIIFYVNTDDKTGTTTGTIRKAVTYTNASDMPDAATVEDSNVTKVINCLYLDRLDGDLEVLVVEQGDDIFRSPYLDSFKFGSISLRSDSSSVIKDTPITFALRADSSFSDTNQDVAVTVKKDGATTDLPSSVITAKPAQIKAGESKDITIATTSLDINSSYTVTVTAGNSKATAKFTVNGTVIDMTTDANKAIDPKAGVAGDFRTSYALNEGDSFVIGDVLDVEALIGAAYQVESIKAFQGDADITTGATLIASDLSVVVTLKANSDNVFANVAPDAVATELNGKKPVCKLDDQNNQIVTLTYTYPVTPAPKSGEADGSNLSDIKVKLQNNDVVTVVGALPASTNSLEIADGKTLVVNPNNTDPIDNFPTLAGKGTVELNATITNVNAADLDALAEKLSAIAPTGSGATASVALSSGLKLKGSGKFETWDTSGAAKTLTQIAAVTGSTTVTPVLIEIPASLLDAVDKKVTATGTLNDDSAWSIQGVLNTGVDMNKDDTASDRQILMLVGDNCKQLIFKIGTDATYTVNFSA